MYGKMNKNDGKNFFDFLENMIKGYGFKSYVLVLGYLN